MIVPLKLAGTKVCPMAPDRTVCQGDKCMAWKAVHEGSEPRGYCGMVPANVCSSVE